MERYNTARMEKSIIKRLMKILCNIQLGIEEWRVLIYGQLIALSLACCSAASATLQDMTGIQNMPLFQIAGGYFFLGLYVFAINVKSQALEAKDEIFAIETTHLLQDEMIIDISVDAIEGGQRRKDEFVQESNGNFRKLSRTDDDEAVREFNFPFYRNLRLHSPWYFYALLAFLDVQANFFVVLSFRHTSLISTNLLTSLSVISVFITSKVILKKVFNLHHFIGGFLMLVGAFFIVSSDLKKEEMGSDFSMHNDTIATTISSQHSIGDFFAVTAALIFGLNDTLAEYCIKNSTVEEYLAMLGIFGYLFSIGESFVFERSQIQNFLYYLIAGGLGDHQNQEQNISVDDNINFIMIGLVWAGYILSLFIFYTMASYFLTISDATLLNLSLQFSNMWTMIFSIVVQHIFPTTMFYFAVLFIFVGVFIYEKGQLYFLDNNRNRLTIQ